nr:hypothetical protein [Candidatus Omnitrophota bacterium]
VTAAAIASVAALAGLAMMGFGGFKLYQSVSATNDVKEMNAALGEAKHQYETQRISLSEYNEALKNNIDAHKEFLKVGQSVKGLTGEQIKSEADWIATAQNAYDTNVKLSESLKEQNSALVDSVKVIVMTEEEFKKLNEAADSFVKQSEYTRSEAGKLGVSMEDIYQYLTDAGASSDDLRIAFMQLQMETGNETALANMFGISLEGVSKIYGTLKEDTSEYTEELLKQAEATLKAEEAYKKYLDQIREATMSASPQGYLNAPYYTELGLSNSAVTQLNSLTGGVRDEAWSILNQRAAGGADLSNIDISHIIDQAEIVQGQRLNSYGSGGIVPGALGEPQMAIVHGGEQVLTPNERGGGNTIIVQGSVVTESQLGSLIQKYLHNNSRANYSNQIV